MDKALKETLDMNTKIAVPDWVMGLQSILVLCLVFVVGFGIGWLFGEQKGWHDYHRSHLRSITPTEPLLGSQWALKSVADESPSDPRFLKAHSISLEHSVEIERTDGDGTRGMRMTYEGIFQKLPGKPWKAYPVHPDDIQSMERRIAALETIINNGWIKARAVYVEDPAGQFQGRAKMRLLPHGVFRTVVTEETKEVEAAEVK